MLALPVIQEGGGAGQKTLIPAVAFGWNWGGGKEEYEKQRRLELSSSSYGYIMSFCMIQLGINISYVTWKQIRRLNAS